MLCYRKEGLIFYNGPWSRDATSTDDVTRFDSLSLELRDGYPLLRASLGGDVMTLTLNGRDVSGKRSLKRLSDGRWHRVDVIRRGRHLRLIVDQCRVADVSENEATQVTSSDRSACESVGDADGDARFFETGAPLQLGGVDDVTKHSFPALDVSGFDGCIKNVIHNGRVSYT